MPELTNSSVGSFAGTSGLEGTMVWPFERKYSRKLERISLDFIAAILLQCGKRPGRRARPGKSPLCVDATVFQEPREHRSHDALVRRRLLLKCAAGDERGEQHATLIL